jgi:hypothetical protein
MKCVACGSTKLIEGVLLDSASGGGTTFKLKDVSVWKLLFGAGMREVRAYGCIHCQHLQLAVEFTEEDAQRYQQFEGQQPGVLERINSEPEESDH